MVDSIGRQSFGRGAAETGEKRKKIIQRVRKRAEQSRDDSRRKLLEASRRYKIKVAKNEAKMELRKKDREKNLNPVAVSLMSLWKFAKSLRNPVNWSGVPHKPKYSGAMTTRERIYGKRFDWLEQRGEKAEEKEKPREVSEKTEMPKEELSEEKPVKKVSEETTEAKKED